MNIKSIAFSAVLIAASAGLAACGGNESRGNDFQGATGAAGENGMNGNDGADICTLLINQANNINNQSECETFLAGQDGMDGTDGTTPTAEDICKAAVGDDYDVTFDGDGDCIVDDRDNCPFTPNLNQQQSMNGRIGDACLGDFDADGFNDDDDLCPLVPSDMNTADVCAGDFDGDSVTDAEPPAGMNDNCPFNINPMQTPSNPMQPRLDDQTGPRGAVCLNDFDGDGFMDDVDNCPTVFNPSQREIDACVMPPAPPVGLIDVVETAVNNLSDETAIAPIRDLVTTLASANPNTPGALNALTGPLNDVTMIEGGPLGPLTELVQALATTDDQALDPLVTSLNQLIGDLSSDPASTPENLADVLLGIPNLLTGLGGVLANSIPTP